MLRILLSFIFLLIFVRPVFADVAEDIKEFNKRGLPPVGSEMDASGLNITVSPDPTSGVSFFDRLFAPDQEKIHGYSVAEQSEKNALSISSFFTWLLSILGIGQDPKDIGNKNAQNFLNARLPRGVGEEMLSKVNQNNNLALGQNPNILGTTPGVSDQAMEYALDCALCASLPRGMCDCNPKPPTPTPTETPSPTPTGVAVPITNPPNIPYPRTKKINGPPRCLPHNYIQSPETLPDICYEIPGKNDFYIGSNSISNGTCKIPTKGYCSVGCLRPFFKDDQKMAEKAAMICYKESQGNAYAVNNGCFTGRSNEYSVGLFQINLKNEDRNPYTQEPRSYQCWDAVESTGGISCRTGVRFDYCTRKFKTPEINIPEAWNLWFDREIYYTDQCTIYGGGLKWIWWGWSTAMPGAVPFYCDIKY